MLLPLCFLAAALCGAPPAQTLATGIAANTPSSAQVALRGNQFIDCERGVELGTRAVAGTVGPVLYSTCNTFQRDAQRDGTAFGFFLQNPPGTSPALVFDDFTRPGQGVVLKDLFDPAGRRPGEYWAFWNQSGNRVDYKTFLGQMDPNAPVYYPNYAGGPSVASFNATDAIDVNGSTGNPLLRPCSEDGFPDTGIQQRAGTATGGLAVTAATLAQNVPNPCMGSTRFDVRLPRTVHGAFLLVRHGLDGREVAQLPLKPMATFVDLDLRGYVPGTYFCTLVVDGIPAQTKRMLVE